MTKKLAKRLFWFFANNDNMLLRKPAWRLLRLFERVSASKKPNHQKFVNHNFQSDDISRKKEQLVQLYWATIEQRAHAPESDPPSLARQTISQRISGRSMMVLVPSLPKHDRTSSGLRIFCLLESFCTHFERVHLVYSAISEHDPIYKRTFPANLVCHHITLTQEGMERLFSDLEPEILLITDLFDTQYIERCTDIVKTMKENSPKTFVVLDTMDCHWKKYVRKAETSFEAIDWAEAYQYLQLERILYPVADLLTVVTAEEGIDITFSIPGSSDFAVLPNCYKLSSNLPNFKGTEGLCFVGPASVNHNLDAMRYMRDSIFPHMRALGPEITVSVVGSGWYAYRDEFKNSPFVFRGHVADLDEELSKYRVFVCPLTYGAGLKGKLGSAASAGIPVVSTSVGSEGYPISSAAECLIADEPELFAHHCRNLLLDESLWVSKRDQLRDMMEKNYGTVALDDYVAGILCRSLEKCST